MKKFNLKTGKLGEEIAREYLEKKGYQILEKNVRSKFGEIDLVGKKGKELVLLEVRTKIGDRFGSPEENLDKKKLGKLRLNAISYVARKRWRGDFRIDAVCIVLRPNLQPERINHYQYII